MLYVILTIAAFIMIFVGPATTMALPQRWLPLWALALFLFFFLQNYVEFLTSASAGEVLLPLVHTAISLLGAFLNLCVLIWRWSSRGGYG